MPRASQAEIEPPTAITTRRARKNGPQVVGSPFLVIPAHRAARSRRRLAIMVKPAVRMMPRVRSVLAAQRSI
jgi:hypothetical protein